jgi:hypothetical protein
MIQIQKDLNQILSPNAYVTLTIYGIHIIHNVSHIHKIIQY